MKLLRGKRWKPVLPCAIFYVRLLVAGSGCVPLVALGSAVRGVGESCSAGLVSISSAPAEKAGGEVRSSGSGTPRGHTLGWTEALGQRAPSFIGWVLMACCVLRLGEQSSAVGKTWYCCGGITCAFGMLTKWFLLTRLEHGPWSLTCMQVFGW